MRLKAVCKRSWGGVFVLRHCGEFVHHGFDVLLRHWYPLFVGLFLCIRQKNGSSARYGEIYKLFKTACLLLDRCEQRH